VRRRGYAFIRSFEPETPAESAIRKLGQIEKIGEYHLVHELRPKDRDKLGNSYSSEFGYGRFPMHTDFAHWFTPPRYVALRCVVGFQSVKTCLLDSAPIIGQVGKVTLQRALVQPRTPLQGHRPILRILDGDETVGTIFRWDSVFLLPATEAGRIVTNMVAENLRAATPLEITLEHPGDTLLIDNWRVLHARSAVGRIHRKRRIERAYLSLLG
jgi:L-asparagine oxygenase